MKQILEQEDEDESIIMDAVCLDLYSEYDDLMPDTSPGVEDEEETKKLQSNPFKKKSVAKHQRYDASSHQGKNSLLDLSGPPWQIANSVSGCFSLNLVIMSVKNCGCFS